MARPREFDRDKVLEKAVEVFWENGYDGSSCEDLVNRMKISRGSLYSAFGDKHSLYLAALGKYRENSERTILNNLASDRSFESKLRDLFSMVIDHSCSEMGSRGCFINNAIVERSGVDPETASLTSKNINRIVTALKTAMDHAIKKGEMRSDIDTTATANFLYSNVQGIQVIGKSTQDRKKLESIAKVAISVIH
jgi:TetR/AcrR family transcriptional repressor of nem operon